jgi:hypothetical protein
MATLYVPFEEDNIDESLQLICEAFLSNTSRPMGFWKPGFLKRFEERDFRTVYEDSEEDLSACGLLSNIYILGHSRRGAYFLANNDGNPANSDQYHHEVRITPIGLAHEISRRGLSRMFSGSIMIFGCSSGEGANSFAEHFSHEMGKMGYRLCGIYGYDTVVNVPLDLNGLRQNRNFANANHYHKTAGRNVETAVAAHKAKRKFYANKFSR